MNLIQLTERLWKQNWNFPDEEKLHLWTEDGSFALHAEF